MKEIVIVGGGTAGWMTACLMADKWLPDQAEITLVESETISVEAAKSVSRSTDLERKLMFT